MQNAGSKGWFGFADSDAQRAVVETLLADHGFTSEIVRPVVLLDPSLEIGEIAAVIPRGEAETMNFLAILQSPLLREERESATDRLSERLFAAFPTSSSLERVDAAKALLSLAQDTNGDSFKKRITLLSRLSIAAKDDDLRNLCLTTAIAYIADAQYLPADLARSAQTILRLCRSDKRTEAHALLGLLILDDGFTPAKDLVRSYCSSEFFPVGELPVGRPHLTMLLSRELIGKLFATPYPAIMDFSEFQIYECCRSDESETSRGMCIESFARIAYKRLRELSEAKGQDDSKELRDLFDRASKIHLLNFARYDIWDVAVWSLSSYRELLRDLGDADASDLAFRDRLGEHFKVIGRFNDSRKFGIRFENLYEQYEALDAEAELGASRERNNLKQLEKIKVSGAN